MSVDCAVGGKSNDDDKAKKIRAEYDAKLCTMQTELRKMQVAKREHTKLLRNQTHYETQLKALKNDLMSLKQLKVRYISLSLTCYYY